MWLPTENVSREPQYVAPTEYVGATSCGALLLIPLGGKAKMTGGYLEKKWIGIKTSTIKVV